MKDKFFPQLTSMYSNFHDAQLNFTSLETNQKIYAQDVVGGFSANKPRKYLEIFWAAKYNKIIITICEKTASFARKQFSSYKNMEKGI
jgi:hypothetical protein